MHNKEIKGRCSWDSKIIFTRLSFPHNWTVSFSSLGDQAETRQMTKNALSFPNMFLNFKWKPLFNTKLYICVIFKYM